MKKINFEKMVASGNDFVVTRLQTTLRLRSGQADYRLKTLMDLARSMCNRKYGVGADGLLVLEKSRVAVVKMRIFNADGSEAEMCGNGARCTAFYIGKKRHLPKLKIETRAGIIESIIMQDSVKIKLTQPQGIKLDIPIRINGRKILVNFINTGVPHVVIFSADLDKINITDIARFIRYHKKFSPKGTNVNFTEVINNDSLKIRTYERGVEDETLACGTGSVAAALIFSLKGASTNVINVYTQSGETLKVFFAKEGSTFKDVWLEGRARIVYKGVYYV